MNMSYCRFQNTLSDLLDCQRVMDEEGIEQLSWQEKRAAIQLLETCRAIALDYPEGDFLPLSSDDDGE